MTPPSALCAEAISGRSLASTMPCLASVRANLARRDSLSEREEALQESALSTVLKLRNALVTFSKGCTAAAERQEAPEANRKAAERMEALEGALGSLARKLEAHVQTLGQQKLRLEGELSAAAEQALRAGHALQPGQTLERADAPAFKVEHVTFVEQPPELALLLTGRALLANGRPSRKTTYALVQAVQFKPTALKASDKSVACAAAEGASL